MNPISQKSFSPRKDACSVCLVKLVLLSAIVIVYAGCARLQPVDLAYEKSLEPAETEYGKVYVRKVSPA